MHAWIECYEQNDLSFLLKSGKLDRFAIKAFEILQDQIIDLVGISETYLRILKAKIRIEEMYTRQIQTGDTSNQLLINIAEAELEKMEAQPNKADLFEAMIHIEKAMGFRLSTKDVSVFDFYNYSKFISKLAA